MSEYVSKKAVLEWFGLMHLEYSHNAAVSEFIESGIEIFESGAFDADNTEIQRLRAALEKARTYIFNGYDLGYIDDREGCTKPLLRQIDEALSTTTGPTGAERVREGDGNDA